MTDGIRTWAETAGATAEILTALAEVTVEAKARTETAGATAEILTALAWGLPKRINATSASILTVPYAGRSSMTPTSLNSLCISNDISSISLALECKEFFTILFDILMILFP